MLLHVKDLTPFKMSGWDNLFAYPPSTLSYAARKGEVAILRELLASGKRPDLADHRGWTPLHVAASSNQLDCVEELLKDSRTNPFHRSYDGETAAEIAVLSKAGLAVVQLLLEKVGRVGMKPQMLHAASFNGTLDIVKLLVRNGCDVNIHEDINEQTPLHRAVEGKHPDVIRFLLDKGAKVNARDCFKCTPLFEAVQQESLECAQILIDAGSKVNRWTSDKITPLMRACQKGNIEMVKFLLSHGANPNIVAVDGAMALTYAVHGGETDIVQLLLPLTDLEILNSTAANPEARSVSLFCVALDSYSDDCLSLLLNYNLGQQLKEWPVHAVLEDILPNLEYNKRGPVSFLLFDKMLDHGDHTVTVLDKLIKNGFPVNVRTSSELPPLVAALSYPLLQPPSGQLAVLEKLINAGADVDYRSSDVIPDAILTACYKCNGPALRILLPHSSVSPNILLNFFIEKKISIVCYFIVAEVALGDDFFGLEAKVRKLVENNSNCKWLNFIPRLHEQLPSLQSIARRKVRECMTSHTSKTSIFLQNITNLNIPNAMKDYIRFKT